MIGRLRNSIVTVIASKHIAGRELSDAVQVCKWAEGEGFHSIVSPWSGPDDTPEGMLERYKATIDTVRREGVRFYLSIKLDSISGDVGMFDELLEFARPRGIRIHLDSLGPDTADMAMKFLERAAGSHHSIGFTLPSRWRRSLTDAERIVELGVPARIVKGQWDDPAARSVDCRKNFLSIADRLAGRCSQVGVATHDLVLAEEALRRLSVGGSACELEQFFSLPLNGVNLSRTHGYPYRIYVAYGNPDIPYNVRFAFSRPSIAAWALQDFALNRRRPWLGERR